MQQLTIRQRSIAAGADRAEHRILDLRGTRGAMPGAGVGTPG